LVILHKDCSPELKKNKELPRDTYLVSYLVDNELKYDIVSSGSIVSVFDYYYDEYRNVNAIVWTDGKINPKSYGYTPKTTDPKKRK
jgi:hypothetical protein